MTLCFDVETSLFQPAQQAPTLVCVSFAHGKESYVKDAAEGLLLLASFLEQDDVTFVGQNVAYDFAVICEAAPELLPQVFQAYEAGRVHDTMIREKLWSIASGEFKWSHDSSGQARKKSYSLFDLARKHLGIVLEKDEFRKRYADFLGTPIDTWPLGSIEYARLDAVTTLQVYESQEKLESDLFTGQEDEARAAWWLHLTSCHGLRTRKEGVDAFEKDVKAKYQELLGDLVKAKLVRPNGTRDMKAVQSRLANAWRLPEEEIRRKQLDQAFISLNPTTKQENDPWWWVGCIGYASTIDLGPAASRKGAPLTPTGRYQADEDACEKSGDDVMKAYAKLSQLGSLVSKDVPMIRQGETLPIHTSYGLAESHRSTSYKPNVQNMRRFPGVRELFIPRPGKTFLQADFEGLELRTFAQVQIDLFGSSDLADAINAGKDPHLMGAAQLLGKSYEWCLANKKDPIVDDARQVFKVLNFGVPGGLGVEKLVLFAWKSYGVLLTIERAKELKALYFKTWSQAQKYFRWIDNQSNKGYTINPRTRVIRAGAPYCAACNHHFQHLGARAAKNAGFLVSKACYVDSSSPLFGSRIVAFIHDELILETGLDNLTTKGAELENLMIKGAKVWLPDLSVSAPALAMACWSKKAKAEFDDNGDLIPWEAAA